MPNRLNVKSDIVEDVKTAILSKNSEQTTDEKERDKDFLSDSEMTTLMEAAKKGRHGVRDYLMLMMMYRHGLRVSEVIRLRLEDLDLKSARLWVSRLKNGLSVEHPIAGDELRAIKHHLSDRKDNLPWLFINERGQPFSRQGVNYLIKRYSEDCGMNHVHPHTLRHSCGYYLANKGYDLRLIQDYLGHRDPKHTVHYTRVASRRFNDIWKKH